MPTSGVSTFRSDREMSVDNSPRLACGRGGTAKRWVRELLVLRGKTPHPRLRRTLSPVSRSQGLYFQCDLLATHMLVQSGAAGGWGSPRRGPLSTAVPCESKCTNSSVPRSVTPLVSRGGTYRHRSLADAPASGGAEQSSRSTPSGVGGVGA